MDEYQPNQSCSCTRCRTRGLMAPAVLVALGVLFLLSEFGVARFHNTWPILLIVIGLVKVLAGNVDSTGHIAPNAPPPPTSPPPPGTPAGTTENPPSQVENV
jgi:hypothetical protein